MILLAIDPGNKQSAYVLFDCETQEIKKHDKVINDKMLDIINGESYNDMAIEMIASMGMPVGQTVFDTCVWIGRFIQAAGTLEPTLIYRKDEKMALCGSMKAKDANIRQALIDMYGKPGTKKIPGKTYGLKADEWSALAVAVTYYYNHIKYNNLPF